MLQHARSVFALFESLVILMTDHQLYSSRANIVWRQVPLVVVSVPV